MLGGLKKGYWGISGIRSWQNGVASFVKDRHYDLHELWLRGTCFIFYNLKLLGLIYRMNMRRFAARQWTLSDGLSKLPRQGSNARSFGGSRAHARV